MSKVPANDNDAIGRIYTIEEAADKLRMSRRNLQDVCKEHPFYFLNGNRKLFTEGDIQKLIEAMRPWQTSSTSSVLGVTTGISEAPTHQEKRYSDLLKPKTRKQPRR